MEAKDWVHEKRQESGKSQRIVLGWGSQAEDKRKTGERMCPPLSHSRQMGRVLAQDLALPQGEAEQAEPGTVRGQVWKIP